MGFNNSDDFDIHIDAQRRIPVDYHWKCMPGNSHCQRVIDGQLYFAAERWVLHGSTPRFRHRYHCTQGYEHPASSMLMNEAGESGLNHGHLLRRKVRVCETKLVVKEFA